MYYRVSNGGTKDAITFKYQNAYTSPLPTSGNFTIGGNAGGILFLNRQFKSGTFSNIYGGFTIRYDDGTTKSVAATTIDLTDAICIYPNAIPGTGYTNYFNYRFT